MTHITLWCFLIENTSVFRFFFSCSRHQVESVKRVLQAASFCQSVTLAVPHKLLTVLVPSGRSDLCLLQIAFPNIALLLWPGSELRLGLISGSPPLESQCDLLCSLACVTLQETLVHTHFLCFCWEVSRFLPPLRASFTLPLLTSAVTSRLLVASLTSYLQINLDIPLVLSESTLELPFKSWSLLR